MKRRLTALIAVIAFAAVTVAAGCGGGGDNNETTTGGQANLTATPGINLQPDQAVVAQLPADVKSSGELTVAADATYPPNEYIAPDGHTIIGMDADLAKAIGQVMGLTPKLSNVTFDAIIPALAARKYDLGMSSFTDTKEREKTVDFVTYLTAGTSVYVKKQGGPDVTGFSDLCGH